MTRAGLHSASDDVPVPLLVLDFGFRSQVLLEFAKRDRVIYCTCNLTAAMHFSVCMGRIVFPAARARLTFRPDSSGFPSATPIGDPAPRSQATGARSAGPSRVRDLARGVWRKK